MTTKKALQSSADFRNATGKESSRRIRMRVLVTGGAGYIGSHAVRALARHGHEPVVYDNLSTGHAELAKGFELIVADIADGASLAAALRGIDAVMHFAAHSMVGESVRNPRKYFENNVRGGLSLLNSVVD